MGLYSSWIPVLDVLNIPGDGILVPPLQLNDPYATLTSNETVVRSWKGSPALSLYDRYIVSNQTGVNTMQSAKAITDFQFPPNITLAAWYALFRASGEPYNQARRMYDTFTSGPGVANFVPDDTKVTPMEVRTAPGTFRGSVSSVGDRYNNGPDWIMVFNNTDKTVGKILDDVVREQGGGYGVIGPGISSMLAQVGYPPGDLGSGLPVMYGDLTAGEVSIRHGASTRLGIAET
jgi:hypothetical protein